ncbi:MAG: hypothetical protein JOZ75_07435 [Candidatus Dormibacteraeota bacterium]|nr:hypothetical protein [Candidatus Dormibacteraeota bacterium]
MAEPDAHALVSIARDLMRLESAGSAGLGPRAAAMLGRQALELALDAVWERTAPGMGRMTARCQRLCLGTLINDPVLGRRVEWAWHLLSDACHHGVYDLAPAVPDLLAALESVWALADSAERLRGLASYRS